MQYLLTISTISTDQGNNYRDHIYFKGRNAFFKEWKNNSELTGIVSFILSLLILFALSIACKDKNHSKQKIKVYVN